jgi:hypothetical protein
MCYQKVKAEGANGKPACVENCPGEALTFGTRRELLEIARQRIYQNPGDYVSHIYGEHEAGGTGVLYISAVPFEELGFRTNLSTEAYPEKTRDFLTAVPLFLAAAPAFLMSIKQSATKEQRENADAEAAAPRDEA